VRRAVEDAGVVDQDIDLAQRCDQLGDSGEISQVVDDVARLLVERQDAEPVLPEQRGSRGADALRGAGDEDCSQTKRRNFRPARAS
jgi:hypothetical protein